jgi:hypothetical protein
MSAEVVDQMDVKEEDKSAMNDTESHPNVRRRVMALKKLQFESIKVEGELAHEVFALSAKYKDKYLAIEGKRKQIVSGEVEPNDKDCELGFESMEGLADSLPPKPSIDANIRGIPGFWLKVMQSSDEVFDWIRPKDEAILSHLTDIDVTLVENPPQIVLKFSFGINEYFENSLLTKTYDLAFGPNPQSQSLWSRDNYYPIARKGCPIEWKDGKNVTQKVQKNKKSLVEEVVKFDSFFDFFDDTLLKSPTKGEPNADEIEDRLDDDWSLGQHLAEDVVPKAVLYYTGEVFSDDGQTSDESDYSSDESDSESQSESESQ